MVFHLARLVEWRYPSLVAPERPGLTEAMDLLEVACASCDLGYLAELASDAWERPASLAVAAQQQLARECPDHAARFTVRA